MNHQVCSRWFEQSRTFREKSHRQPGSFPWNWASKRGANGGGFLPLWIVNPGFFKQILFDQSIRPKFTKNFYGFMMIYHFFWRPQVVNWWLIDPRVTAQLGLQDPDGFWSGGLMRICWNAGALWCPSARCRPVVSQFLNACHCMSIPWNLVRFLGDSLAPSEARKPGSSTTSAWPRNAMPHLRPLLQSQKFCQYPHQTRLQGAKLLTHHPLSADSCCFRLQPDSGRCQDCLFELQNGVVSAHHPLQSDPCWRRLQPDSERCQGGPFEKPNEGPRGVNPLRVVGWSLLTPISSKQRTMSRWPAWAARCNGVSPISVAGWSLLAPTSTRKRTMSRWPLHNCHM